jgi:hypothetical protein
VQSCFGRRVGKPDSEAKKKQKNYYSGKKKRHTMKSQIVVDKKNQKIICTSFGKGREHDFKLFKESRICLHPEIKFQKRKAKEIL